jgi:methyl-accepting chemotaxis protein
VRLTIRTVLIGIVSLLVLLLGVQAWMAVSRTAAINANAEDVATRWLPSIVAAGEIKFLTTRIRLGGARMLMTTDPVDRGRIESQVEKYVGDFQKALNTYEPNITSSEERALWSKFLDKWQTYDALQKRIFAEAATSPAKAAAIFNVDGLTVSSEVFSALEAVIKHNEKGAELAIVEARTTYSSARMATFVLAGFALLIGAGSAVFVLVRITSPMQRLNAAMATIAEGKLDTEVMYVNRSDELGDMAKALLVFKENGLRFRQMEQDQKTAEQATVAQRKRDMAKLADEFEQAVGEIVNTVSSASTELEASANTLTATAGRAEQVTTMVAAASEEASTNVQSVASATEELSASVSEIGRQVQESARMAGDAVSQATTTMNQISNLSDASSRIGDVVELINTIASQTNLLALNATIEAARAGDAGRGFAVVASEVKVLAEQTARATSEIGQQITGMQAATKDSVLAIKGISGTIERLSEIASTIAAAVEEQGAATQEIARNVQQAAHGTQEVSSNIADVQRGAVETGGASSQVLSSAQQLSTDSMRLKTQVQQFLATVRAA